MRLTWESVTLRLRTTFRTAHGASETRDNVVVRLEHGGRTGLGEAAGLAYHGESPTGIQAWLEQARDLLREPPAGPGDVAATLERLPHGSRAARAALDMALHDLWGQAEGQPLWRLWGLEPSRAPLTSFTIGLDTPEAMAERAAASEMPVLKIKVGDEDDEDRLHAVRRAAPRARLRIDANAGWSREQAAALLPRLADLELELVEQPLDPGDLEGMAALRRHGVPLFADESVRTAADVEACAAAGAVDGVVVKLAKSGGLTGARRVIAAARRHGLRVMVGCMIESSVGVTAAAHLAPACDLADLDGPLLISNDPYRGVRYAGARLLLPEDPGLGVAPRAR